MGRNNSSGVSVSPFVQISPHVAVVATDPNLRSLQEAWQYANRHFSDVDEAAKWQLICEGGGSPCDYRLKALFLKHNVDWLTPAPARKLFGEGDSILITDSPAGEVPLAVVPCDSFTAGTRVLLANGRKKSIEKLKPGDRVLSTDLRTGKNVSEPVVAAFGGSGYKKLMKITVASRGLKSAVIFATDHHRFYVASSHRWVRADRLAAGETLRTPGRHSVRVVASVAVQDHPAVRDLTIFRTHTFYVMAGAEPLLVHNSCEIGRINPNRVKFAQRGVSKAFRNGKTIAETVEGIQSGEIDPENFPPIRLVSVGDDLYTLDHRRLVTFQKAGLTDIPYVMATPEEAAKDAIKFDEDAKGTSIEIRGTGETWEIPEEIPPIG